MNELTVNVWSYTNKLKVLKNMSTDKWLVEI